MPARCAAASAASQQKLHNGNYQKNLVVIFRCSIMLLKSSLHLWLILVCARDQSTPLWTFRLFGHPSYPYNGQLPAPCRDHGWPLPRNSAGTALVTQLWSFPPLQGGHCGPAWPVPRFPPGRRENLSDHLFTLKLSYIWWPHCDYTISHL